MTVPGELPETDRETDVINESADVALGVGEDAPAQDGTVSLPAGETEKGPNGKYNPGVVLIKSEDAPTTATLSACGIISAEPLYAGSKWYLARLSDAAKTVETVNALREQATFTAVDYDYIMGADVAVESVDVTANPDFEKSKHFGPHGIQQGWKHINDHDRHPGGSPDVVVAVIDTGVDYTHLDLRNNIWTNTAEIPDNGLDDDGNGYVDDVNGWNCVGDNNDPMDDNGHGTHVAGIIAAENNSLGGVGVAYNCKIMPIKAGNSSGYFNNSDIAEAIQYAYMNGASVINMSFGGSSISIAVEEALENAYTTSILVAAAGNDSLCNNLAHAYLHSVGVSYPAALPYVIGVMSVNSDGSAVSGFSNYDDTPYDSVEYEVYAVGQSIPSTWPGNKYATLQGTSMAAPSVSGIAALLRSFYTDREIYSTKFIQSQIVNTGTLYPYNAITKKVDEAHSVANVYEALTQLPKPEVNLYEYRIDDSTAIAAANNGNGVIDAGETVRLYVSLHNRGGVATAVKVSIDTVRNNDPTLTDPYFTFVNSEMVLSDIGTYSVRESGEKYFEIVVSSDCPNDYLVDFNIRYTYENGLDEEDATLYTDDGKQKAQFNVSRGYHLPSVITEDTVYTADRLYIVAEDVIIPAGVTVTFEEGCEIQFYADKGYYNSPVITVYGTLNITGTKENMVRIYPSERYAVFMCGIINGEDSVLNVLYVDAINLYIRNQLSYVPEGDGLENYCDCVVANSILRLNTDGKENNETYTIIQSSASSDYSTTHNVINSITDSLVEITSYGRYDHYVNASNCYFSLKSGISISFVTYKNFKHNIIFSEQYNGRTSNNSLGFRGEVKDNMFLSAEQSASDLLPLYLFDGVSMSDNTFSPLYQQYASQVISGYIGSDGLPSVDVYGSLTDASLLYPHVVSVELFNQDGQPVNTVGREEITVRVTFNRPMDTTQNTVATFGTVEPYGDYEIAGEYVSDTVWEGKYTLKAQIENGQNFIQVKNACAAEDPTMKVYGEHMLHEFTIDTTAALSMTLQAEETAEGIKLTWLQDDYDTLMGYNIYRSDSKDGNFVKLNPAILLDSDGSFTDTNAEPGKTYWYTFTVVLSDFTESAPAGKVVATAADTLLPNLYHTPVNQGYAGNNLVISAVASDNVGVVAVTLYYRTVGDTAWKSLAMAKVNDKYSATVFGSDVTMAGLEYYILATDGRNEIQKGSADTPYTVVVKDPIALSRLGDVDGDSTVTAKDALMIMQTISGERILSDDQFKRADLDKDGMMSAVEALRILQYVNGNITTLEM